MTVACVLRSGGDELPAVLGRVPALPGVYAIEHSASGRAYVGRALNIRKRWRSHLKSLAEGGNRTSAHLRNAWQKYGPAAFRFRVLVLCEPPHLLALEQALCERLGGVRSGFNRRLATHSNLGMKFGPPSEETRRKIGRANAIALRGKPGPMRGKKHGSASRERMSRTKRLRGPKIAFNGRELCLSAWADEIGISTTALGNRLRRGWPLDRALTEPGRGY